MTWRWCLAIIVALSGSVVYIVTRAIVLRASGAACGVPLTLRQAIRVFTEGVFVELILWPGKVWSDAYRVLVLSGGPQGATKLQATATIATARAASITSNAVGVLVALVAIDCSAKSLSSLVYTAIAVAVLLVVCRYRSSTWVKWVQRASIAFPWAFIGVVADAACMGVLGWASCHARPSVLIPWYVVVSAAAGVVPTPLGVGPLEAGCVYILTTLCQGSASSALTAILAYRLLGPGMTVSLGFVSTVVTGRTLYGRLSVLRRRRGAMTRGPVL